MSHVNPPNQFTGSELYIFPCEECGFWMVESFGHGQAPGANVLPSTFSVECHGGHVCEQLAALNPHANVDWFASKLEWERSAIEPKNGKITEECTKSIDLQDNPPLDVQKLATVIDRFTAEHIGVDPSWHALESVLPIEDCAGFMFMNRAEGPQGQTVYCYKHGITRRYLNLDSAGKAFKYNGAGYDPIDLETAINHAFDGIERCGATRTTPYDDAFRAMRNQALADAGYLVLGGGNS